MLITDTLSPQAFEEALRAKGAFYHIHHPYHIAMHNGDATREQIQGWVANRFYYQTTIPLKDAAIMANCPDAQPGANGCSGSSTTTAATARTAGLKPGCGWGKRSG
ncbi:coenzyme PQQ synthesis protein C [Klebsiella pneumoniae]|uniref:Coenzyme PQQ synthesis protein C n=1 Tax=Klebsiella pneumoniae TaxID=573 RepID=A0A377X8V3_KLEPN|nr:coenzyme PQQ synthesis protein C [Klebsiella pneumoniae]